MRMKLLATATAIALLSGCAALNGPQIIGGAALGGAASQAGMATLESTDTFAKCAAADVVTTTVGLSRNVMHEVNPLTKALTIHALGRVAGTIVPVIGLSIAGYWLLREINRARVTRWR